MKHPSLSYLPMIALLFIFGCKSTSEVQHLAELNVQYYRIDGKVEKTDPTIESLISDYREEMNKEMLIVIGDLPEELTKSKPNSNLGNWFSDMLEEEAQLLFPDKDVDFAIQNYGGLRVNAFAKGPITQSDIFELMPFDNTLVLIKLPSETVQQLLDRIAHYGGWPISKSLQFTVKDSSATEILIHNQPLNSKEFYNIALPDYIANGGDQCDFLLNHESINSGIFIRTIIIDHIKRNSEKGKPIVIDPNIRIKT